jgi:hypothetical protein
MAVRQSGLAGAVVLDLPARHAWGSRIQLGVGWKGGLSAFVELRSLVVEESF